MIRSITLSWSQVDQEEWNDSKSNLQNQKDHEVEENFILETQKTIGNNKFS